MQYKWSVLALEWFKAWVLKGLGVDAVGHTVLVVPCSAHSDCLSSLMAELCVCVT